MVIWLGWNGWHDFFLFLMGGSREDEGWKDRGMILVGFRGDSPCDDACSTTLPSSRGYIQRTLRQQAIGQVHRIVLYCGNICRMRAMKTQNRSPSFSLETWCASWPRPPPSPADTLAYLKGYIPRARTWICQAGRTRETQHRYRITVTFNDETAINLPIALRALRYKNQPLC